MKIRRMSVDLPEPVYLSIEWCQLEIGAPSKAEIIRHAVMDYRRKLLAERAAVAGRELADA